MEDSFIAESLGNGKYIFGVFDGHGGNSFYLIMSYKFYRI